MLLRNDLITGADKRLYRVLHIEPESDSVWLYEVGDRLALPRRERLSEVNEQARPPEPGAELAELAPSGLQATKQMIARRNQSWERIAPLVASPRILEPATRGPLVRERAAELGCSERTLMQHLRRYWAAGQTLDALMPKFRNCGRRPTGLTGGCGRQNRYSESPVYQLTYEDLPRLETATKWYLADERRSMTEAYQHLREQHYVHADEEGRRWLKPRGQCPSLRQFRYFLHSTLTLETQTRRRKGDREFERDHRPVLGTVMQDCQGVGHYYEIDATIADVYLVAGADRSRIIGKPTLYLIIDRASRLITGYYVGLENASWNAAQLAILSICEDKRALCKRLGLDYDAADWPAHGVLPQEFLADRGEILSEASNQLPDVLHVTVTNVPSMRPDWKPLVESGFRLLHQAIRDTVTAYDPPSNATKRRGKHYEKDASLTLAEFEAIIVHAIVEHNRTAMRRFPLSLQQLADGVKPAPRTLWEHGIRTRMGALARRQADSVRFALLPQARASVTEAGIVFRGCHYGLPANVGNSWFVKARNRGRYSIDITYDPRRADAIYVHAPRASGGYHIATLLKRSAHYNGLSFEEVHVFEHARKVIQHEADESRARSRFRFHRATAPIQARAEAERKADMKASNGRKSRSARRADTREDRAAELALERERTAAPLMERPAAPADTANIVPLHEAPEPAGRAPPGAGPPACTDTPPPAPRASSLTDKVRQAQRKMIHGR